MLVCTFNQEKAFSVIVKLVTSRCLFPALIDIHLIVENLPRQPFRYLMSDFRYLSTVPMCVNEFGAFLDAISISTIDHVRGGVISEG